MPTTKSIAVPANHSLVITATCQSAAQQHVQLSCNGQTVELSGTGQGVPMTDANGDSVGGISTGGDPTLSMSFWSSANDNPFVSGPFAGANPVVPGSGLIWALSNDTEAQEDYSMYLQVKFGNVA